jgi:hypothetical protein
MDTVAQLLTASGLKTTPNKRSIDHLPGKTDVLSIAFKMYHKTIEKQVNKTLI